MSTAQPGELVPLLTHNNSVVCSHCRRMAGDSVPAAPTMVGPPQRNQVAVPSCPSTGIPSPLAATAAQSSQQLQAAYHVHAWACGCAQGATMLAQRQKHCFGPSQGSFSALDWDPIMPHG